MDYLEYVKTAFVEIVRFVCIAAACSSGWDVRIPFDLAFCTANVTVMHRVAETVRSDLRYPNAGSRTGRGSIR